MIQPSTPKLSTNSGFFVSHLLGVFTLPVMVIRKMETLTNETSFGIKRKLGMSVFFFAQVYRSNSFNIDMFFKEKQKHAHHFGHMFILVLGMFKLGGGFKYFLFSPLLGGNDPI